MKKFNKTKKILLVMLTLCVIILAPLQSFASVDEYGVPTFDFGTRLNSATLGEDSGSWLVNPEIDGLIHTYAIESDITHVLDDDSAYELFMLYNLYPFGDNPYYKIITTANVYSSLGDILKRYIFDFNYLEDYATITIYSEDPINGARTNLHSEEIDADGITFFCPSLYFSDEPSVHPSYRIGLRNGDTYSMHSDSVYSAEFAHPQMYRIDYTSAFYNYSPDESILVTYSSFDDHNMPNFTNLNSNYSNTLNSVRAFFLNAQMQMPEDQDLLDQYFQNGFQQGTQSAIQQYESILQSEKTESYNEGYTSGYNKGKVDGASSVVDNSTTQYKAGYNKGYNDGVDDGFRKGTNATEAFVGSFDRIAEAFVDSVNIFSTNSDTIFGINLMSAICTFVALGILWSYIRKVF